MKINRLSIEVVAALPDRSYVVKLEVPLGTSVLNAVERSSVLDNLGPTAQNFSYGIFGKKCRPDMLLTDGDRVEVYRKLEIDPKDRRRLRAASQKSG